MLNLRIGSTTLRPEQDLEIELDFTNCADVLIDASNLNINILKVDVERNNSALGLGQNPEAENNVIKVTKKLPSAMEEGVYVIAGIVLLYGEDQQKKEVLPIRDDLDRYFLISNGSILTRSELSDKVKKLMRNRHAYVNAKLRTLSSLSTKEVIQCKVIVFAVGCLIHSRQLLKGYVLHPLRRGFSYQNMLDTTNNFLEEHYQKSIEFDTTTDDQFANSTPLFAIEFTNCTALDADDASQCFGQYAENIYTALAHDRGRRPESYAIVVFGEGWTILKREYHFPSYYGNLAPSFNVSGVANNLERTLPIIEKSPWINLLLRTLYDAKPEENIYFSCLKYWSILEMIAKKHITDNNILLYAPDGGPIKYEV